MDNVSPTFSLEEEEARPDHKITCNMAITAVDAAARTTFRPVARYVARAGARTTFRIDSHADLWANTRSDAWAAARSETRAAARTVPSSVRKKNWTALHFAPGQHIDAGAIPVKLYADMEMDPVSTGDQAQNDQKIDAPINPTIHPSTELSEAQKLIECPQNEKEGSSKKNVNSGKKLKVNH